MEPIFFDFDPELARALARGAHLSENLDELREALSQRQLTVHEGPQGPLLVRGTLPAAMVAIVGARASDPYGLAVARRLAMDLAGRGFGVVSGGAEGCDHAAHLGALDAGGKTVVVLPCGHDHIYPRAHASLYQRILTEGGALVSAWWPTTPLARWRFLARNRVIAQLAQGVIVTRARARSGSLATARAAKALGRPVAAVPGAVGEVLSAGCHLLLEDGAVPIIGPRSIDRWLGRQLGSQHWPLSAQGQPAPWAEAPAPVVSGAGVERDPVALAIIRYVRQEPGLDLDAMSVRTGTPISALAAIVLGLEIEGVLERWTGGGYHLRRE